MVELANRIGPEAEPLAAPGGVYFRWADPSGAELWVQVSGGDELLGLNPHFAGKSVVRVRLTARINLNSPSPLDGRFHGWADPSAGGEEGAYPLVFDAPDARLHDGLSLPAVVEVQVAAFAHEVEAFASPQAYAASQEGDGPKFGSQSFIPTGLFTEADAPPQPTAVFTGHVVEAERRVNRLTGRPFFWVLVDTYGGVYDVVIDPALLSESPAAGGVLTGSFWLTGRIRPE